MQNKGSIGVDLRSSAADFDDIGKRAAVVSHGDARKTDGVPFGHPFQVGRGPRRAKAARMPGIAPRTVYANHGLDSATCDVRRLDGRLHREIHRRLRGTRPRAKSHLGLQTRDFRRKCRGWRRPGRSACQHLGCPDPD